MNADSSHGLWSLDAHVVWGIYLATAARYRYCHRRSFAVFPHQGFTGSFGISDIWGKIPNCLGASAVKILVESLLTSKSSFEPHPLSVSKGPWNVEICWNMLKHLLDAGALCEEEVDRPVSTEPRAVWLQPLNCGRKGNTLWSIFEVNWQDNGLSDPGFAGAFATLSTQPIGDDHSHELFSNSFYPYPSIPHHCKKISLSNHKLLLFEISEETGHLKN